MFMHFYILFLIRYYVLEKAEASLWQLFLEDEKPEKFSADAS